MRYDDVNSEFAECFAANQDLAARAQEAQMTAPLAALNAFDLFACSKTRGAGPGKIGAGWAEREPSRFERFSMAANGQPPKWSRVLPEHQHLDRHDLVLSGPGNRASWEVIDVDPPHYLVLMGADPDTHSAPPVLEEIPDRGYVASTWQWVLRGQPAGRTRLIVRQRLTFSPHQRVLWQIVEPINFVMEKEMLRGIARRAERTIRSQRTHAS